MDKNKKMLFLLVLCCPVVLFAMGYNNPIVTDNGDIVELNNGILKMSFKKDDRFNLYSMSSVKNNQSWITSAGMRNAIWVLTIEDNQGISTSFNSSSQVVTYNGFTITDSLGIKADVIFSWSVLLEGNTTFNVFVSVSMSKNIELSEWEFKADLPSNYILTKLTFPRITFVRNNSTKAIFPMGWGAEYNLNNEKTYTCFYPSSSATVQLMCMHKGGESLYFATHDQGANIKNFNITTNATTAATLFTESETSLNWTDEQGHFVLPWKTSIGIHPEGWIKAVKDWYRPFSYETDWGKKTMLSKDTPEWIKKTNFWLVSNSSDGVENLTQSALDYFGAQQTASHAVYWHNHPFDTYYPEYFPPKSNFINLKNRIQSSGSHIVPYINGRLWDSTTDYYMEKNAKASAVMNKDESIYYDVYENINQAVMCPSTDLWRNTLFDITQELLTQIQADGVYYDQIASAKAIPCWNPNHGHSLGGGDYWVKDYRKLIAVLRQNGLSEGQVMTTEQNAECYIDLFDAMYMTNRPRYRTSSDIYEQVPLFQYIYSDRVLLYGFNVINTPNVSLIFKNALSLLWGGQIGAVQTDFLMTTISSNYRNFLRTLTNFRDRNQDIFLGGELMREFVPEGDNPTIEIPDYWTSTVIRGAKWKSINGQEVSILVNFDSKAHWVLVEEQEIYMEAFSCKRMNDNTQASVDGRLNLINDGYFINTGITSTAVPNTALPEANCWYSRLSGADQQEMYIEKDISRNNRNNAGLRVVNGGTWHNGLAQRISAPDNGIYRVGFWGKYKSYDEDQPNKPFIRVFLRANVAGERFFQRLHPTGKFVTMDQVLTEDWEYYTIDFDLSKIASKDNTDFSESLISDLNDFSLYFSNFNKTRDGDLLITGITMTKVDNSDTPSIWYNPGFEESYAIPYLLLDIVGNPERAQVTTTKGIWALSLMDGINDPAKSRATVLIDTTEAYSGKRSMRLDVKSVKDFSKVYLATTLFDLPKDNYVLNFYLKSNVGEAPFRIDIDNYNIEKIGARAGFPFSDAATIQENYITSTKWEKYEVEFNNGGMSDTLAIAIRPNLLITGISGNWSDREVTYWFDDFLITSKGSSPLQKILPDRENLRVIVLANVVIVSNAEYSVELFDINGRLLDKKNPNEGPVRFNAGESGIYIVRSGGVNKKLIIR